MKLAPFQDIGVDFLASKKVALLADEMRLGKSAQLIRAADKLKARKIKITCPATSKHVWVRELDKWSEMKRSIQVIDGTKANISKKADVTIINYDLIWRPEIKKQLVDMEFGVGFNDESHYLGGRQSKRTVAMLSTKDRTPIISRCHYKWFASGTPILNRPRELYPMLASCAPWVIAPYYSYKAFTRHFCGGYWDGVQWYDKGATNTKELNDRLHNGFMLRRLRKDYLDELPINYQLIPIEMDTPKIQNLVAQEFAWEKDAAKYQTMDDGEEIATVRRKLGLAKVPWAVRHVKSFLSIEDKLVVGTYHREVLDKLQEGLKQFNPVVIKGGMSPTQKAASENKFRDDPTCRVIIGQIISAGVSIDLSSSNNIFCAESSWVWGEIEQFLSRCSGHNQNKQVGAQFMVIKNSLEEHMMRTVIDKKQKTESVIERSDLFN